MAKSLPPRPNLEQLKTQAKDLLKSHQSGNPDAANRIHESHPRPDKASFSLADAQLVIAREHGFASWAKLKEQVESILLENGNPLELFKQAFIDDDARLFRRLIERHPAMKTRINEPVAAFDAPAITQVRSREMLDVLIEAGADINARSRWWAGGFGLLHQAEPELAAYAVERGALVDVHAAARLGMLEKLRELVSANPTLVHSRGGDGQTPLHFAGTVRVAEFLLDQGADIDALDIDHESTPVQHMMGDRQEIARYLVRRGCRTDILLTAALGDMDLVRKHLDADPDCVRLRVNEECFPMVNQRSGGTIYQWTLGWHVAPHDVARRFGHHDVFRLLIERSPTDVKLLIACWDGDEAAVRSLLDAHPALVANLSAASHRQVTHAARNNNLAAVRVMLAAGFPIDARGQHGATPLHWAAFHGNAAMIHAILRFNPPLELTDTDFHGTPLGWAIHGCEHGWYCKTGDYAAVVESLLEAGAKPPEGPPRGTEAVRALLRK